MTGYKFFLSALIASVSVPAVVQAQGVEEIFVTARKFTESLQDAPISISAFSAEGLDARGIETVTQIGQFAPNVQFNSAIPISASNATAALFIRGIGQNDYQLSADPGVGLYLDGVYIARNVGNVLDILDVERIEILRGPQGTLFGRNTIGGAVNVVTKKPGDELGGKVELTTGRYGRIQTRVLFDTPITDTLAASVSGLYHKRKGFVEGVGALAPDLGDTDQAAGRIALRWTPTEKLEINIAADGSRSREESAPNVLLAVNEDPSTFVSAWNGLFSGNPGVCANPADPTRFSDPRCINNQYALGPYQSAATFDTIFDTFDTASGRQYESASDMDIWGVSGIVDYEISDELSAKSITAYRKVTGFWTRDSDHTPAAIVQTINNWEQEQFSQELQLNGNNMDGRLKWVVGGYFSDESGNHEDYVGILDALFLSGATLEAQSLAFFGQATYEIIDNLSLTVGLRWTEDEKTFINSNQFVIDAGFITGAPLVPSPVDPLNPALNGPLLDGTPLAGPLGTATTIKDDAITPLVSLAYRWSDELMTYVSYSEGFKGGGFTQRVFPPLIGVPSFEPEFSTTYEVGFKSNLLDNRVRLNGAVFWNEYDDLQVTVNDPVLGFAPIIRNAAQARIRGFELEVLSKPTPELMIEAGIGFLDAEYTDVDIGAVAGGSGGGVTLDDQLQNAPKWTLSAGVSYDFAIGSTGTITPRLDWSFRSMVANDAVNTPLIVQESYHLLNASLIFKSDDEAWRAVVGVKNLTDEAYLVAGYEDAGQGIIEGVFSRPREWFLTVSRSF